MSRLLLLTMTMLSACTSLQPRPEISSLGCMQAVRAQLPTDRPDKRLHCLASAQIARQCSVSEAYLAGMGKELRDLFSAGDAEWADWQADRAGVRCRRNGDAETIEACCAEQGY
jgi:hypothetical protein